MTGTTRSSEGLDERRKRLLFRCWHRGTREMDLILGRFADTNIASLTDDELAIQRTVFASDALTEMVVMVTGATGGIGRAIAWLFARLGAHVVLVGRNQVKLDALTARLRQHALKASSHVTEIRKPEAVQELFDAIWKTAGRVDSLINSAGGQFPQAAIDISVSLVKRAALRA